MACPTTYDVGADRLRLKLRPRHRGGEVLGFMRMIRRYPRRVRIYWIRDNLSPTVSPRRDRRLIAAEAKLRVAA